MAATSNGSLPKLRVGIIGGGPAGLATLKYLLMAPQHFPDMPAIDVRLFEMEPTIGGTLRYRVYEQAEMVSSRYLTSFSDFRFPAETQDFPTPTQYAAYLDAYAEQWGLMPHVECGKRVVSLQRLPGSKGGRGKHRMLVETVASGNRESWDCDAVAICVGVNSVPTKTTIPGVEIGMPGKIKVLHSSQFKGRDDFGPDQGAGKTVVVVGAGETGSDIAHLAITSKAKEVILCHRHGFTFAPKVGHAIIADVLPATEVPEHSVPGS